LRRAAIGALKTHEGEHLASSGGKMHMGAALSNAVTVSMKGFSVRIIGAVWGPTSHLSD